MVMEKLHQEAPPRCVSSERMRIPGSACSAGAEIASADHLSSASSKRESQPAGSGGTTGGGAARNGNSEQPYRHICSSRRTGRKGLALKAHVVVVVSARQRCADTH